MKGFPREAGAQAALVVKQVGMVGRKVANYAIKRLIGEGGRGQVFEAVHEPSGRRVAIKILRAWCTDQPKLVKRFFNELRAKKSLVTNS